jgi:hypothetical protein
MKEFRNKKRLIFKKMKILANDGISDEGKKALENLLATL